jgi:AcrR family transcriptional regulator
MDRDGRTAGKEAQLAGRTDRSNRRGKASGPRDFDTRIVDSAVVLAEEVGWDAVKMRDIADRVGLPFADLQSRFRDLDAIADAWFARAVYAMLAPMPRGFAAQPARERLFVLLMRWFDALAPHRTVTAAMLRRKLHLPHPHHWAPMIFSLSRTIQLLRDAARLDAGGRRRQIEEVGLTALFLGALAVWRRDDSPDQARTRDWLRRRLARADRAAVALWGAAPPPLRTRTGGRISRRDTGAPS